MSTYTLHTAGATLIKKYEGFSLKFYGDPKGYPTVGWGHLITRSKVYTNHINTSGIASDSLLSQTEADALSTSLNLTYTSPITSTKASKFFTTDTSTAVALVNALTTPYALSQSQFDALVSLTFNGGTEALYSSDVTTLINSAQIYANFPNSMTSAECDSCSKLVSRAFSFDRTLQPRRNSEATLFCTGQRYTHKYPVYTL